MSASYIELLRQTSGMWVRRYAPFRRRSYDDDDDDDDNDDDNDDDGDDADWR